MPIMEAPMQETFTEDVATDIVDFDIENIPEVPIHDIEQTADGIEEDTDSDTESEPDRIEDSIQAYEDELLAKLGCAHMEVASDTVVYSVACDRYGRAYYEGPGDPGQIEDFDSSNQVEVSDKGQEDGGSIRVRVKSQYIGDRIIYTFAARTYRPAKERVDLESWGEEEIEAEVDTEFDEVAEVEEAESISKEKKNKKKEQKSFWEEWFGAENFSVVTTDTVAPERADSFWNFFPETVQQLDTELQTHVMPLTEAAATVQEEAEVFMVFRGEDSEFSKDVTVLTKEENGTLHYEYREIHSPAAGPSQERPAFAAGVYETAAYAAPKETSLSPRPQEQSTLENPPLSARQNGAETQVPEQKKTLPASEETMLLDEVEVSVATATVPDKHEVLARDERGEAPSPITLQAPDAVKRSPTRIAKNEQTVTTAPRTGVPTQERIVPAAGVENVASDTAAAAEAAVITIEFLPTSTTPKAPREAQTKTASREVPQQTSQKITVEKHTIPYAVPEINQTARRSSPQKGEIFASGSRADVLDTVLPRKEVLHTAPEAQAPATSVTARNVESHDTHHIVSEEESASAPRESLDTKSSETVTLIGEQFVASVHMAETATDGLPQTRTTVPHIEKSDVLRNARDDTLQENNSAINQTARRSSPQRGEIFASGSRAGVLDNEAAPPLLGYAFHTARHAAQYSRRPINVPEAFPLPAAVDIPEIRTPSPAEAAVETIIETDAPAAISVSLPKSRAVPHTINATEKFDRTATVPDTTTLSKEPSQPSARVATAGSATRAKESVAPLSPTKKPRVVTPSPHYSAMQVRSAATRRKNLEHMRSARAAAYAATAAQDDHTAQSNTHSTSSGSKSRAA